MRLTSKEAKELLESLRTGEDNWIEHSLCVGDCAGRIAEYLVKNKQANNRIFENEIDIDKAISLGYIHDIGKYNKTKAEHAINGYLYLRRLGYDNEYCDVCLTHSFLNNDVMCTAGGIPHVSLFITEFIKNHKYTLEEKIINLCDLMCPQAYKIYTIDKRLIDIMLRHGVDKNTQYHITETYKLKKYFDYLLGCNVYDLFPEIKNNL